LAQTKEQKREKERKFYFEMNSKKETAT
jgi:hypothetical protein